ncbi:MAG TPA: Na+/H+ antiporter NhaA, partial [Phenylobacterium sp.]|nr:Na+/H+ antiporter NhaA [Phenylobacterium sp.]
ALGLFLGKQAGIFASAWMMIRLGWADLPRDATWTQLYGVAVLCGIGFTMSLFVGNLAFSDPMLVDETKIGVLIGSGLSAILGLVILSLAKPEPQTRHYG